MPPTRDPHFTLLRLDGQEMPLEVLLAEESSLEDLCSSLTLGPPARCPFSRFFFGGGFPYEHGLRRKKGTLIRISLLEGLAAVLPLFLNSVSDFMFFGKKPLVKQHTVWICVTQSTQEASFSK